MDWLKVTVRTTTEASEIVSQVLIEAGAGGTQIEDRRDIDGNPRPEGMWDILDPSLALQMSEDVLVTAYYPDAAPTGDILAQIRGELERLRGELEDVVPMGSLLVETDGIDEEDWAENWKKDLHPFRIGKHMVVRPGWTEYEPQPGDRVLEIDPGMAFGTGTHETTALCVELIEEYLRPGDSVIDIGTGSGILSIAAAECGAGEVLATDIDPLAVKVAAENIRRNGCDGQVTVRQGDLLAAVDRQADIVVANIIADVIAALAAPVRDAIRPGGLFLCSGIAYEREEKVLAALREAGYAEPDIRRKGEWVAMAVRRDPEA